MRLQRLSSQFTPLRVVKVGEQMTLTNLSLSLLFPNRSIPFACAVLFPFTHMVEFISYASWNSLRFSGEVIGNVISTLPLGCVIGFFVYV